MKNVILLIAAAFLSCNHQDATINSTESVPTNSPPALNQDSFNAVEKNRTDLAVFNEDSFNAARFWKNYDTLHLDRVKVFKNSIMHYKTLPSSFYTMKNLKAAILDTQIILDSLTDDLCKMNNLEVLVIQKSSIRYIPKCIGKLTKLRFLTIHRGTLLKEIPKEISLLNNLEELDLFGNNLQTLPDEISALSKLKVLKLGENNFSDHEKQRIKKLLPHCKVLFEYDPEVESKSYEKIKAICTSFSKK